MRKLTNEICWGILRPLLDIQNLKDYQSGMERAWIDAAKALALGVQIKNLRVVLLQFNNLGDIGIAARGNLKVSTVRIFDASFNSAGQGCGAQARAPRLIHCSRLCAERARTSPPFSSMEMSGRILTRTSCEMPSAQALHVNSVSMVPRREVCLEKYSHEIAARMRTAMFLVIVKAMVLDFTSSPSPSSRGELQTLRLELLRLP